MALTPAPTVQESLIAAMDKVIPAETPAETPAPALTEVKAETPPPETEAQKAERLRDEKGRFVEGKPESKPAEAKVVVPAAAPKPKVPRPSSWKKELESHWDTLAPEVQSYVTQREREYATGVSTYKTEADRAKDVMGIISNFEPVLQQDGIDIKRWLQEMGIAHHTLARGTPQDKVYQTARIIQSYGVDAQALFQVLSGQQPQGYQQVQPQRQQPQPQDIEQIVEEKLLNRQATSDYKAFTEAKDEHGNPKYPYFEDVKGTMAGLLQADLAQDYPSAYEAAVRHPRHANIWEALQTQQSAQKEAERIAAATATAQRARSQAVSVKSSTPSATAPTEGPKGRRDTIADAFDAAVTPSRV